MPFQGLIGFGGGATSLSVGGAAGVSPGLTATGGIIHDYTTPPGTIYRIHTSTNPGNFAVTALSQNPTCPDNIDYLIIGGGGGGSNSSNNPQNTQKSSKVWPRMGPKARQHIDILDFS